MRYEAINIVHGTLIGYVEAPNIDIAWAIAERLGYTNFVLISGKRVAT